MQHSPQLTILIPTHRRPLLLARALRHYAASGLNVIVADSTQEPFALAMDFPMARYLHLPGMPFESKLQRLAESVETPYAVLCADDDLTNIASMRRCAHFLDAHPDHVGAHGHYVRVLRQAGRCLVEPCYLDTHRAGILSDVPRQRLLDLCQPYVPLFYAVLRAEVLRRSFGPGHEAERFYASSELALGMVAAMLGKVAVLPTLHTVRDIIPSVDLAGPRCDNLGVVSTAPQYREVYGLFTKRLSHIMAEVSGLDEASARQAVLDSIAGFVVGYCARGKRRPLWRKLPKYARRLARVLVPGQAASQDAQAQAARIAALETYLSPAGAQAHEELACLLTGLECNPG